MYPHFNTYVTVGFYSSLVINIVSGITITYYHHFLGMRRNVVNPIITYHWGMVLPPVYGDLGAGFLLGWTTLSLCWLDLTVLSFLILFGGCYNLYMVIFTNPPFLFGVPKIGHASCSGNKTPGSW